MLPGIEMDINAQASSFSPGGVSSEALDLERSVARTAKIVARRNLKRKTEFNLSDLDLDESIVKSKQVTKRNKKKVKTQAGDQEININVVGENLELNLAKQYQKNAEHCDREEIRNHVPTQNKKDR